MSQDEWEQVLEDYRREQELEGFRPRTIAGRLWVAGRFVHWCREREVLSPIRSYEGPYRSLERSSNHPLHSVLSHAKLSGCLAHGVKAVDRDD